MNTSKRDFDKEAASWDTPPRVKLAEDVASAIAQHVPLRSDMDILDFGCGTGLLSLALRPKVRSVTGVDSSQGMLDVFNEKISQSCSSNVKTFFLEADKGVVLPASYHLIVMNMTLHHIKDVQFLLDRFYGALLPGGCLAIADLDSEGGLFHASHEGVFHHGFNRAALRGMFVAAGFKDVRDCSAAEFVKPLADGDMRCFGIFLMTGRRLSINIAPKNG